MNRSIEHRWQRAQRYLAEGQRAHARATLDSMRNHAPRHPRTHLLAAQLAWHEDRVRDATSHALDAAGVLDDDEPEVVCEVIDELMRVGEIVAARACLGRTALTQTTSTQYLLRCAGFHSQLHQHAEALALAEQAIHSGATNIEAHFRHAIERLFVGRPVPEIERELGECLNRNPTLGGVAYPLSRLRKQTAACNHLDLIDAGLRGVPRGSFDHAALEFARYKELEDLGRYDEAWLALANGNAVMRQLSPWDVWAQDHFVERLQGLCQPKRLPKADASPAGPQPIFIIGLPRSGTTVLERMLTNHPQVAAAGELVDFHRQLRWVADTRDTLGEKFLSRLGELDYASLGARYLAQTQWRAQGKLFYVDKLPSNWANAGFIHAALPQTKVLHVVRDAIDVCFSNFRTYFEDTYQYSYDFAALASYHRGYQRVMAHWHAVMPGVILDVPYAELVRDPEATLRKVFDFCGLMWEPDCIDVLRNQNTVSTLSAAQVRQPLHTRGFEEWRPYAAQLAPLRHALEMPDPESDSR